MKRIPGTGVLIVADCRTDGSATGMKGVYDGGAVSEYLYDPFIRWNEEQERPFVEFLDVDFSDDPRPPLPAADLSAEELSSFVAQHDAWLERNRQRLQYYIVVKNPRIRLDDGGVIWGDECWWTDLPKRK